MSNGKFNQWEDIVLEPVSGALVQDIDDNLFTGTAKLYICPPGSVITEITPVDITVTSGAWSHELTLDLSGIWAYEIRSEGSTHGTSGIQKFSVNPSPFPAPVVVTP